VFAVLAFSLSVVDMALILAPGNPPPLAVLATRWFSNYELSLYYPAAAAASLQLVLVVLGVFAWLAIERLTAILGRRWIERGGRSQLTQGLTKLLASQLLPSARSASCLWVSWCSGQWQARGAFPRSSGGVAALHVADAG
jgi:putative thiamine transport system permease protein